MMNEEDNKAEGLRRSLPTKQIKISIQLSFHDDIIISYPNAKMDKRVFKN